jgi:ribonuclease M5
MPIIVEGKYDKITLENVVDTLIITTDGFGIFKDKEKCDLIRKVSANGVIVMTDSDSAGSVIRAYLKKIVGEKPIINVYVPCLKGKEKRKSTSSKEGLLGVEGMSPEIIREALKKSGVREGKERKIDKRITKNDMFLFGFSGMENSTLKRKALLKKLELPENLTSSALLDVINNLYTYEEFGEVIKNF